MRPSWQASFGSTVHGIVTGILSNDAEEVFPIEPGNAWMGAIAPQHMSRILQILHQAKAGGPALEAVATLRTAPRDASDVVVRMLRRGDELWVRVTSTACSQAVGQAASDARDDRILTELSACVNDLSMLRREASRANGELRRLAKSNALLQAETEQRAVAMRRVLDTVNDGLLTIDREGRIGAERSAAANACIASPFPETIRELFSRMDPVKAQWLELGLEMLWDGALPIQVCLAQLPETLSDGARTLALRWKPLRGGEGELEGLLLVTTDITLALKKEAVELKQRELTALLREHVKDPGGMLEFQKEAADLVSRLCASTVNSTDAPRHLHTLKATFGMFKLNSMASLCHRLEQQHLDRTKPHATQSPSETEFLTATERAELAAGWAEVTGWLAEVGLTGDDRVQITRTELLAVASRVHAVSPDLGRAMERWRLEPVSSRLERLGVSAQSLAARLGKGDIRIRIEDGDVRLETAPLQAFWSVLAHAIRNAVDHGLETPEERVAAGKAEAGTLTFSSHVDGELLHIGIADDGRGIAWAAIASKAKAAGLPAETQEDLVQALFVDALSTADQVSETSGRGVGMSALRAAVVALGGDIRVQSAAATGTRFTFRIPLASCVSDSEPGRRLTEATSARAPYRPPTSTVVVSPFGPPSTVQLPAGTSTMA